MEYIVYFQTEKIFVLVNKDMIFDLFYNDHARIWFSKEEIDKFINKKIVVHKLETNDKFIFNKTNEYLNKNYFKNLPNLKNIISKINNKIPLYDIYSDNLFLIYKDNVYQRVIYNYYRFPDTNFYKNTKNQKIINFLNNFNLETLENTYIRVFYYYSNKVGKNLTQCIRPSFLSHLTYIKPYYTRSEVINMALNMRIIKPDRTYYTNEKIQELCKKVRRNDINRNIILNHQKYIVDSDGIHRTIYYSLNGAYFMNKYMRNTKLVKNKLMEKNILGLWSLIKNAPVFDKSYKLYRFVDSDNHLSHLMIGDTYTEQSFISTTRNPFYNSETYKFGFILIKIKIPENVAGVALCMETFSNFRKEEEIIFPPQTHLKLVKKNENSDYYHIDDQFSGKVVTKYEFEYVGSGKIEIIRDIEQEPKTIFNDFSKIKKLKNDDFLSKTEHFSTKYSNQNYQFISQINGKNYTFICEWYDSTSVYEPYFFIKSSNGFYIYCQNPNTSNLSLTLELSENEMHVNYYSKFSYSDDYLDITTFDAIKFIAKLAYIFGINHIYIHQEYKSCQDFIEEQSSKYKDFKKRILEMHAYRKDYFDYFIGKKKRFDINGINPKFYYYQLDNLFKTPVEQILRKTDKDELYQIYQKFTNMSSKTSYTDFYIYIVKNRPEFIELLEDKSIRIFKKDNPFILDFYLLEGFKFLYNNGLISSMPEIKKISKQHKTTKNLNKSNYRLDNFRRKLI